MHAKRRAGDKAAELVENGMLVGLGTGSTVYHFIEALGRRVHNGLRIRGVPTSSHTEDQARAAGIPLVDLNDAGPLDLAVDGADELNPALDLIKGGGGALLREKLVALAARRLIIVADTAKLVQTLGAFPLPVEVVPFGWQLAARQVAALGCQPVLRMRDGQAFVTDNGNYVLDCPFDAIERPGELHKALKLMHGVVETGLFAGMADLAIIGHDSGVDLVTPQA